MITWLLIRSRRTLAWCFMLVKFSWPLGCALFIYGVPKRKPRAVFAAKDGVIVKELDSTNPNYLSIKPSKIRRGGACFDLNPCTIKVNDYCNIAGCRSNHSDKRLPAFSETRLPIVGRLSVSAFSFGWLLIGDGRAVRAPGDSGPETVSKPLMWVRKSGRREFYLIYVTKSWLGLIRVQNRRVMFDLQSSVSRFAI